MTRFHTAIAMPLSLNPFPISVSVSLLNYIGIAIAKKWVQYPFVSDVAIGIANAQWKQYLDNT